MKRMAFVLLVASLVTACSTTRPGAAPETSAGASLVAFVHPVVASAPAAVPTPPARPAVKPPVKAKAGRAASTATQPTRRATPRTKALPLVPTGGAVICVVGKPCLPSKLTWKKTVGCTRAWRQATGLPCPPGWPAVP